MEVHGFFERREFFILQCFSVISFADNENQSKIYGTSAANFLKRSGLNENVLHEVSNIFFLHVLHV
jgi:hypothetical protein